MSTKRTNSIDQESVTKKVRKESDASNESKFVDAEETPTVDVNEDVIVEDDDASKDSNIDSALIAHSDEKEPESTANEPVNPELFIEEPYAAAAAVAEQAKQPTTAESVSESVNQLVTTDIVEPVPAKITKQGKPEKDSEEYHRLRKESHKEVERRRRENINAGIQDLASLLPSPETHKYLILVKAAEYIKRLKENESNNTEKWTLEKLLKEQTNNELSASNEKLKNELERAYRELEHWKKMANSK